MRKGFIIGDFLISTIVLSAIGSIFLSTYLMSYQSDKLDFFTQKRMSFESLIKKTEISCKETINSQNEKNSTYISDSTNTMDKYITYISASCDKIDNSNNVKLLSYQICIYPNRGNTAFLNYQEGSNNSSDTNCKTGERYVSK